MAVLGNSADSPEFLRFLNNVSSNITMVRGDFDTQSYRIEVPGQTTGSNEFIDKNIPLTAIIKEGEFKIGCCSGSTIVPKSDPLSLLSLARQLDVDIMLWGGTHNVEAYTLEEKFFVNPGSCTGAFSTDWPIMGRQTKNDTETEELGKDVKDMKLEEKNNSEEKTKDAAKETGEAEKSKEEDTKDDENVKEDTKKEENTKESKEDSKKPEEETETKTIEEADIDISELEISGSNVPSFCLLDTQGSTCTLYIYMFIDGEVKVDKVTYTKPSEDEQ